MSPSTKSEVSMPTTDAEAKEDPIKNSVEMMAEEVMNVTTTTNVTAISKVKDIKLPEGVYSGEMKNGKRHGYGIMKWNSGFVEECCWQDDFKHGLSKRLIPNGVVRWFCSTVTGDKSNTLPDSMVMTKFPSKLYPMIGARYKLGSNDCIVNLANGWTMNVGNGRQRNSREQGRKIDV